MTARDLVLSADSIGEEVHKLETRLWKEMRAGGRKTLLVTSALRGEGKSTLVALLAAALAEGGDRKILVVDFDMREPQLARHLKLRPWMGVAEVLRGEETLSEVVQPTDVPGLHAIPAGVERDVPLLSSSRLGDFFREARESYDLVLCDSPALVPVADAAKLVPHADGIVLMVMAGQTTRPHLARAREQLLGMGGNILGLVVVNAQEAVPGYYRTEHYYPRPARGNGTSAGPAAKSGDADGNGGGNGPPPGI
jgi:capsular exopolysaccharide synthesis family protein